MLGTAYLDDSADPSGKVVFLAAGFFCPDGPAWKQLRRQWRKVLKPHNIPYYRSYDWRTLSGSFANLPERWGEDRARRIADRLRKELHDVIEAGTVIVGFAMGVDLHAHREVDALPEAQQNRKWMRECRDYQVAAFRNLFCRMTYQLTTDVDPTLKIAFVCDDSTHFRKINRGYERVKQKFPDLREKMLSLTKLDDKFTPELQMADLMADVSREMMQKFIASDRKNQINPSALDGKIISVDLWDKTGMLSNLYGTTPGA